LSLITVSEVNCSTYDYKSYIKIYKVHLLSWTIYDKSNKRRGLLTGAREKGEGEGVFREVRK